MIGRSDERMPMATEIAEMTIPQPPPNRFLGNLLDLDREFPIRGMMRLARQYGPIFRITWPNGRSSLILSSYELINEVCDEKRFDKLVWVPLLNVRPFSGDGLFTARTSEPNWRKAHNILLPNFSMRAMQGYLPMMVDIAEQLMQKWARLNPDDVIDVPADMTRLTLDTIGLCGFGYRFNSFYRQDAHPFVEAMVGALAEAMAKGQRLPVQNKLMIRAHRQFAENIALMEALADKLIQERKADPEALATRHDLLNHMLTGVDKQTGERLDDLNIRYQLITFLIAGHETTSGLLSFALYYLLKNPAALERAYTEVDRVLGADLSAAPTYAQVNRLVYVQQILKEALRLWPTAPAFALYPYASTTLAGKYPITQDDTAVVLIPQLHRDPAIWGDDAEDFRPERFAPEAEASRPINAFKPFGNGQRACIGRQFAMQEAALVLGMVLQRFELIDYADYQLAIKQTLTLKPDNFTLKVRPRRRDGRAVAAGAGVTVALPPAPATPAVAPTRDAAPATHGTPLLVLHGSNLGTAEGLAEQIAADGRARGFKVTVASLDDHTDRLPRDGATIVVSASYNGTPPDNAAKFCTWLREREIGRDAFAGVRYTVFGCGDRNWATTYQAIPTLIDRELAAHGAKRIYLRGEGDAADDFDGQFRAWYDGLWAALGAEFGVALGAVPARPIEAQYTVELVASGASSPFMATYGARPLTVLENRELLTALPGAAPRSTRHLALALPAGMAYRAGDHLGVLPRNGAATVERVLRRFGLDGAAQIVIRRQDSDRSVLPLDRPIAVRELLANYVELQEVATRAQIATLAAHTECPPEKVALLALIAEDGAGKARYREEVHARHRSPLDLLEQFAACELPFERYLAMLPPLKPRYYSISSSPRVETAVATVTVAVVEGPARSGEGTYRGTASNYLREQEAGATIFGFIHAPNLPFGLPSDPQTPIIMVGPGTGLAPFRGFLQERAADAAGGAALGHALLFFGCRDPQHDFLYAEELQEFAARGVVTLQTAFSRQPGKAKTYVQERIVADAPRVWTLLQAGAVVYVCGEASRKAPAVRAAFAAVYRAQTGAGEQAAEVWLRGLETEGRYRADVWAAD
jgi:cytochrome P450/NADPH-cytochrome P450 reductase